jgi:hypothetical protein
MAAAQFINLHLRGGTLAVNLVVSVAAAGFLIEAWILIYGAHHRWYEEPKLNFKRWFFPVFLARRDPVVALIYGYSSALMFTWIAISLLRGLTR